MLKALLTRWSNWRAHRRALWDARLALIKERNAQGLCGDCGVHPICYPNGNCDGCEAVSQL
jgi:hypothetical protein